MSFTAGTTRTPQSINKTDFLTTAQDILDSLVHGDSAPLKDAITSMQDYLDSAVDLDETQKAGIFADFLKDSYVQINQQALGSALELHKTNADLEYASYKVEADYALAQAQDRKLAAEAGILEGKSAYEIELIQAQAKTQLANQLESLAKLKKQYGYANADLDTGVLGTSTDDGAIDKQIVGYDKVNYKDTLKAINEMTALLINANVTPGPWLVDIQKLLIEAITDGHINIIGESKPLDDTGEVTPTTVTWSATGTTPSLIS